MPHELNLKFAALRCINLFAIFDMLTSIQQFFSCRNTAVVLRDVFDQFTDLSLAILSIKDFHAGQFFRCDRRGSRGCSR